VITVGGGDEPSEPDPSTIEGLMEEAAAEADPGYFEPEVSAEDPAPVATVLAQEESRIELEPESDPVVEAQPLEAAEVALPQVSREGMVLRGEWQLLADTFKAGTLDKAVEAIVASGYAEVEKVVECARLFKDEIPGLKIVSGDFEKRVRNRATLKIGTR
jgi:hypothetical protein